MSEESHVNVRLKASVWGELRRMKFDMNVDSYSQVIQAMLDKLKEESTTPEKVLEKVKSKIPVDTGKAPEIKGGDKTIIVSRELGKQLHDLKMNFALENNLPLRGGGAFTISHVLQELIAKYQK